MSKILSNEENNTQNHIKDEMQAYSYINDSLSYQKLEEEFTVKYSVPDDKTFERLLANMKSKGFSLKSREGNEAIFTKENDGSYDI